MQSATSLAALPTTFSRKSSGRRVVRNKSNLVFDSFRVRCPFRCSSLNLCYRVSGLSHAFSITSALFDSLQIAIPNVFKQFHTLCRKTPGWPLSNQSVAISPLDIRLSTASRSLPPSAPPKYPPSRPYGLQSRTNPTYLPRSLRLQPLSYQSPAHSFHQQWGYPPPPPSEVPVPPDFQFSTYSAAASSRCPTLRRAPICGLCSDSGCKRSM